MRDLTAREIGWVAGGADSCSSGGADDGNEYLGGTSPSAVGDALIAVYEGLVAATSHVIERVATAFGD